jgi:eukaryotic-like serine/threonine-protein kinase
MTDEPLDEDALNILDDYLARLQSGEKPDRDAIVRERPELASALDCLEALEQLAQPVRIAPTLTVANADTAPKLGELPRDFGPYELIREIGRGGMGVVYEARQKGLERSVAVKMILAGNLASPDAVRRFQVEAKAAARLRHSNIVHIHEVGQFNGQDFFAMEFIKGQSLAQRIRSGPVDSHEAVRLVATVARAVEHLHQQGIVHRDLKPSNILLDADGQPYVTDFGLAKLTEGADMTATGAIAGTPSYMAPEQASPRRAEITQATDVYSLGAILYELLTGEPPFHAETAFDTLVAVLSGDPAMPRSINPRVPRGLELICLKCLSKEPRDRYASAAALADELDRFALGEALEVRPPTVAQRCWSWMRRQPALASRLGAIAVFYIVDMLINYRHWAEYREYYIPVSLVIAIWISASFLCQRLLADRRWSFTARFAWGTLDALALLTVLLLGSGAASPLVVAYPLAIVASGLWFRVRFVWFMTLMSLLSYGVLVLDFRLLRPNECVGVYETASPHVVFVIALIILGLIVAYLVERVRILSSFYGKPL